MTGPGEHAWVRPPAVAGTFYPQDAAALAVLVDRFIDQAPQPEPDNRRPVKAVIAPHAGYVYSGVVAGWAYAHVRPRRGSVTRVVLAGPSHRVDFTGCALSSAAAFETPLGAVPVDRAGVEAALAHRDAQRLDQAHEQEHGLEVHLPFLVRALGGAGAFTIVPIVVGRASVESVAAVLESLWAGDETLIVVSSDLSHFLDDRAARRVDRRTADAIEAMDASALDEGCACGRLPIAGLLIAGRAHGLRTRTLGLANSADAATGRPPRRDSVVGYGAWTLQRPSPKGGGQEGEPPVKRGAS